MKEIEKVGFHSMTKESFNRVRRRIFSKSTEKSLLLIDINSSSRRIELKRFDIEQKVNKEILKVRLERSFAKSATSRREFDENL